MGFLAIKKSIFAHLLLMLCCVLIASFGMHAISLKHDHPGHSSTSHAGESDSLGNYMHGTDKKLFLFTVLGFLFLGIAFLDVTSRVAECLTRIRRLTMISMRDTRSTALRLYDVLLMMYRVGILNTKAY